MKTKILFKIILITILLIMLFPYNSIVMAATVKEVGEAIATFALKYYTEAQSGKVPYIYHPSNLEYPDGWTAHRAIGPGVFPTLNPYKVGIEHYALDCVGWVNFCVYNVTGLEYQKVTNGSGGYVTPFGCSGINKYFVQVTDGPKPGDIGISNKHVFVCIGDRKTNRI